MNQTELAWAAGFFDGEGSTSTTRAKPTLAMSITQNERSTLERFQNAVGGQGNIYPRTRGGVWIWQAGSWVTTQAVVAMLWKYLSEPKREQAHRNLRLSIERRAGISARHRNGRKTHCHQGHLFDEVNTRINRNGSRACRACESIRRSKT